MILFICRISNRDQECTDGAVVKELHYKPPVCGLESNSYLWYLFIYVEVCLSHMFHI